MDLIPNDFAVIMVRLLLTAILAGIIGMEREAKQQPAGLRTHLLVGVGSCLMMILNITGFDSFLNSSNNTITFDPARIPSYVISGIGFLGAGTIIMHKGSVKGLTTAASIWVAAGIGLVIGIGMYLIAVLTTLIVLVTLYSLGRLEKKYLSLHKRKSISVIAVDHDKIFASISGCFEELGISIADFHIEGVESFSDKRISKYTFSVAQRDVGNRVKLVKELEQLEGVYKIIT